MEIEVLMDAVRAALRKEMGELLRRSPSADRRKLLDRAVKFQLEKMERRFISQNEDPESMRALLKACFEDAANEMRASFQD